MALEILKTDSPDPPARGGIVPVDGIEVGICPICAEAIWSGQRAAGVEGQRVHAGRCFRRLFGLDRICEAVYGRKVNREVTQWFGQTVIPVLGNDNVDWAEQFPEAMPLLRAGALKCGACSGAIGMEALVARYVLAPSTAPWFYHLACRFTVPK